MKTEDIISVLDNAKRLLVEQQPALRTYALDKSVPLEKRFKAWVQHCDKRVNRDADINFVTKMHAAGFVVPLGTPGILTWSDILHCYPPYETVKELLIEENFGSLIV